MRWSSVPVAVRLSADPAVAPISRSRGPVRSLGGPPSAPAAPPPERTALQSGAAAVGQPARRAGKGGKGGREGGRDGRVYTCTCNRLYMYKYISGMID